MKQIPYLKLPVIAALALMQPLAAFAVSTSPTPKPKGAGGGGTKLYTPGTKLYTPGAKLTGSGTPPPKKTYLKPVTTHPSSTPLVKLHGTPVPKLKPAFTPKPVGAAPTPKVSGTTINNTTINNTNNSIHNTTVTKTTFVKNAPTVVRPNTWGGPKGGSGRFNVSNGYGGRWFAPDAHPEWAGWNRFQINVWGGHHWRWFNGGWINIDGGFWPEGYYYYPPHSPIWTIVQSQLANMGYYSGPVDGVGGPDTRQALANYQNDNGLSPSGPPG